MITTAFISLWATRVGAVAWNTDTGIGTVEYASSFIQKNWPIAPVKMPINRDGRTIFNFPELKNSPTFKGLPGLLADALPDRYANALINAWLARQGRPENSLNPVEMLCFAGSRAMGALEFEPAEPKTNNTASTIEIAALVEIAGEILSGRKNFKATLTHAREKALHDILKIGSSAGGARPKAVIAYNPKTGQIKSGQMDVPKGFSHWLIKFDGVTDKQLNASQGYGRIEMAYYRMAIDCGIEMAESRLLEENGRAHFMTKRFDRDARKGKLHVQSFCAMQHYDFNNVLLYSYEQLFATMRQLGLLYPAAEQLYRRMVFNVMARNCDDHTKNFAFIMNKQGTWSLSPAFDVCYAYRPASYWVGQHALSINGKRKNITQADLLQIAKQANVKKAAAIIKEISLTVSHWSRYAKQQNVAEKAIKSIKKNLLTSV